MAWLHLTYCLVYTSVFMVLSRAVNLNGSDRKIFQSIKDGFSKTLFPFGMSICTTALVIMFPYVFDSHEIPFQKAP